MWLVTAMESLPWLVTLGICRAECRPGPVLLERSHCPALWCLLCLETPLQGHSGTTRGREAGRDCPSVPRVSQSPVTSRNKVSASLLWCEDTPDLNLIQLVPTPAHFPFLLLPAQRAQGKWAARGQMPGAALWSGQTLREVQLPSGIPHPKSPERWIALAEVESWRVGVGGKLLTSGGGRRALCRAWMFCAGGSSR